MTPGEREKLHRVLEHLAHPEHEHRTAAKFLVDEMLRCDGLIEATNGYEDIVVAGWWADFATLDALKAMNAPPDAVLDAGRDAPARLGGPPIGFTTGAQLGALEVDREQVIGSGTVVVRRRTRSAPHGACRTCGNATEECSCESR